MVEEKYIEAINQFINEMGYLENNHVLGVFFYGSVLTGFNNSHSDLDLHIVFDNYDLEHLYRGIKHVNGIKIEYFEKPILDLYLSVYNDFFKQSNAGLNIIGRSKIIFDKSGNLKKMQDYTLNRYSSKLPELDKEEAREFVSIINNRMERLVMAYESNQPNFIHLYHLTLEKIRKFYTRLNGLSELSTSKVYRIYTDSDYRESFCKEIPDDKFVSMYLDATQDNNDNFTKLTKIQELYNYAKRNVDLDDKEYQIHIKSRNNMF